LPGMSELVADTAYLCAYWWTLPLLFLVIAYPTIRTGWRLQARGELSIVALLRREYAMVNSLWPLALVLYPTLGWAIIAGAFAPLFKLIDKLGG